MINPLFFGKGQDIVLFLMEQNDRERKTKDINGKGVIQDAPNNARLIVTFDSFWTRLFRVKGEYIITNRRFIAI